MGMRLLKSEELNYIIYRYFLDSNFAHTAFNFWHEAGIDQFQVDNNLVPTDALVKLVVSGLHYIELEANQNDNNDADEGFSFFDPMDLITKDVSELQNIVKEKKRIQQQARGKELATGEEGPSSGNKGKEKQDAPNIPTGILRGMQSLETGPSTGATGPRTGATGPRIGATGPSTGATGPRTGATGPRTGRRTGQRSGRKVSWGSVRRFFL